MIFEKEGRDRAEVFLRLLLIGGLCTPSGMKEDLTGYFQEMYRSCGITLHSSEFTILDSSWMGNSLVTIAKYTLDYTDHADPSNERIFIEGTVTTQHDEFGTLHIRILTTSDPTRTSFKTEQFRISPVSSKG
jgi:hypothetical protein